MKNHNFIKILILSICVMLASCGKDVATIYHQKQNWCNAQAVVGWGDSHMEGMGTLSIPMQLSAALMKTVYNMGIGGETSIQTRDRFLANIDLHKYPQIFLTGGNNNWDSAQISRDLDLMISKLHHDNYLVIGLLPMNAEVSWKGDSTNPMKGGLNHIIMAQNKSRAKKFGSRFIDALAELQKHADGSFEDSIAIVRNIVPPSLQIDFVHLNSKGNQILKDAVLKRLQPCIDKSN